jgi:SAM-dependent methyltransferase
VGAKYNQSPSSFLRSETEVIPSFAAAQSSHVDRRTVSSFGEEWNRFDSFSDTELEESGRQYFDGIDELMLNQDSLVMDVGCGSGRWSRYISDRAGFIEAVDPSEAVLAAVRLTADKSNIRVTQAGVDNLPFDDETFDFVFSLGVLHHVPDTAEAIKKCVKKVKTGGHFLIYLYYDLDNRGSIYRLLFRVVNVLRRLISSLPSYLKGVVCDIIAFGVYLPMVFIAWIAKVLLPGDAYRNIPLSYYLGKSVNIIRNDTLDRFGTPLEQRFSRAQIEQMLVDAGLEDIVFSEDEPYWHAVGRRI